MPAEKVPIPQPYQEIAVVASDGLIELRDEMQSMLDTGQVSAQWLRTSASRNLVPGTLADDTLPEVGSLDAVRAIIHNFQSESPILEVVQANVEGEAASRRHVWDLIEAARRRADLDGHFWPINLRTKFEDWASKFSPLQTLSCKVLGESVVVLLTELQENKQRIIRFDLGFVDRHGNSAGGRSYDSASGEERVIGFQIDAWKPLPTASAGRKPVLRAKPKPAPVATRNPTREEMQALEPLPPPGHIDEAITFIRSALAQARAGSVDDLASLFEVRRNQEDIDWFYAWAKTFPEQNLLLTAVSSEPPGFSARNGQTDYWRYNISLLAPSPDGQRRHGQWVLVIVREYPTGMKFYGASSWKAGSRIALRQEIMKADRYHKVIKGTWQQPSQK